MKRLLLLIWALVVVGAQAQNFPTIGSLNTAADAHILRFPFLFGATNAPPITAQRMRSWWNNMLVIGAYTNLQDVGLFRRDQNAGYGTANQALTINGNTIQFTNANWTLDGLFINTTNGTITTTFAPLTNPFTLLIEFKGVNAALFNPIFAALFYLQNSNAYATASFGAYLAGANRAANLVQFPSATTSIAMVGQSTNQIGLEPVIPYPRTFVFTVTNGSTAAVYCDGLPLGPTTAMTDFNLSLGRLVLGNRLFGADTCLNGTYCSYAIWTNQCMTAVQVSNVVQAWRWLDPAPENIVIGGDSTSAFIWQGNDTNECWPNQIAKNPWGQNKRFYNVALNGATSTSISNYVDVATKNWGPRVDGAVTKSTLYLYCGINDFLATNAPSSNTNLVINNIFGMNAMAKDRGFRTILSTFHYANFWNNTGNTNFRTAINSAIVQRSPESDGVIRRDLLFPIPGEPYVTYDDYHLNTNGNVITRDVIVGDYGLDNRLIPMTNFLAQFATLYGDGYQTNALVVGSGGIQESNALGSFTSSGGSGTFATLTDKGIMSHGAAVYFTNNLYFATNAFASSTSIDTRTNYQLIVSASAVTISGFANLTNNVECGGWLRLTNSGAAAWTLTIPTGTTLVGDNTAAVYGTLQVTNAKIAVVRWSIIPTVFTNMWFWPQKN